MHVTTTRGARAANHRANFRDKRYGAPKLLVDLLSGTTETRLWSATQMILRDLPDTLASGAVFTGAFRFEDQASCGLFEAQVTKLDPTRRLVGATFGWINSQGRGMIESVLAARLPDSADPLPAMEVTLTHGTINWSLSGMLLERYQGAVAAGELLRGMIRLEKTEEPGLFEASVIRVDDQRRTLALKFQELSGTTFDLLEAAIQKSNAN